MMLERCGEGNKNESHKKKQDANGDDWTTVEKFGRRDALRERTIPKPVGIENSFGALSDHDNDNDDDQHTHDTTITIGDDHDNNDDCTVAHNGTTTKRNPNRRQRAKQKFVMQRKHDDNDFDDEAIRDAAARDPTSESEWIVIGTSEIGHDTNRRRKCVRFMKCNPQCNHNHNNNTWLKPSIHVGDNNKWVKPSSDVGKPNCIGPHFSRGTEVTCPSRQHGRASQCPCSWSHSSALLAGIDPSCISPHEWRLCGVEMREVMSPHEGPPAAKLELAPRRLCQIVRGTCYYSSHEVVRSRLAFPSTSTWPSPIEGWGPQECGRAMSQTDIAPKTHATCVAKFRRPHTGSMLVGGQAQAQRCSSEGLGANSSARVVAANSVCVKERGVKVGR